MKNIILIFITLFLFGCNFNKKKQSKSSNTESKDTIVSTNKDFEKNTQDINYQVAIDFLNSYIENGISAGMLDWTKTSSLATENFKKELEQIVNKAWEEEPEFGLDFDPIFDGQDYPTDGFELFDIDKETGYVIAKGIKWESFKVTLKLINENGKTLVEGSGVVNIPEEKRTER